MWRLGIDTGGTFTDFALLARDGEKLRLRTLKVLSTPEAPERAILQGLEELGLGEALARGAVQLVHGSTVATNAALEGKGVRTVFITSQGFADLLAIARQTRPKLYALEQPPRLSPVPPALCLEAPLRRSAEGEALISATEDELREVAASCAALEPRAVAINLLFSYLDPGDEIRLESVLREALPPDVFISRSSAVLPEYREYERGIATWLNASLGPLMQGYLDRLRAATRPCPLSIMQSSGGTISAEQAAGQAVRLLLSGPAGGLAAIRWLAATSGIDKLLTFDMGGTSTDVALYDGNIGLTNEGHIGGWPVAVPMVDMHTIGAGGGSIAWIDSGGLLQVGPRSAGANPGPACYGRGGPFATVTDANLALGRLLASIPLGNGLRLDPERAKEALQPLAQQLGLTNEALAEGILRLANERMAQALRVISVERGHDPREFTLCCFGGAGGLHVCALARELGMKRALVPAQGGVLSALGMLVAPQERQYSQSVLRPLTEITAEELEAAFTTMAERGIAELVAEGEEAAGLEIQRSADLRYRGQSATLTVPWHDAAQAAEAFERLHEERYRHRHAQAIELVNLRVAVTKPVPDLELPGWPEGEPATAAGSTHLHGYEQPVPYYRREELRRDQVVQGPVLIIETNATTFIEPLWQARVDALGNLRLSYLG